MVCLPRAQADDFADEPPSQIHADAASGTGHDNLKVGRHQDAPAGPRLAGKLCGSRPPGGAAGGGSASQTVEARLMSTRRRPLAKYVGPVAPTPRTEGGPVT